MSTLESERSNPPETFYLQRIIRAPDKDSFIARAQCLRTGFPVEATISSQQVFYGLQDCYVEEVALRYFKRLEADNIIEPQSVEGTPLLVSANELVHFGFNLNDVLQSAHS